MMMEQFYYSERDKGKGFDPTCKGFQIAACSPGIGEPLRAVLADIAVHYGRNVLTEYAPREAKELERQLRLSDDEDLESAPAALVEAYPPVWDCYRLADGRMTLSRASYRGFVKDGRPGNFFVHSLVYAPSALAPYDYNPLLLVRSGLLLDEDPGEVTVLPTVSPQPGTSHGADFSAPLASQELAGKLPVMLEAFLAVVRGGRPVVIALPGWREPIELLEALFALLPPYARARLSFCTNESDPRWQPDKSFDVPARAAHDILFFCGPESGAEKLTAEDYRENFVVFNFTEKKFSTALPPGDYARFAAGCFTPGGETRLHLHHRFAYRLGCDDLPDSWDVLVKAIPLHEEEAGVDDLAEGLTSLLAIDIPAGAMVLYELIRPHLLRFAGTADHRALFRLAAPVARLQKRLAGEEGAEFASELTNLAATAFALGRAQLAEALAQSVGPYRSALVQQMVIDNKTLPDASVFAAGDEARTAAQLVAEALTSAKKPVLSPSLLHPLLELVFRTAATAGIVGEVWNRLGSRIVEPCFRGEQEQQSLVLLRRLLGLTTPGGCPDGFAFLASRLLIATRPQEEELLSQLTDMLREAERSPQVEQVAETLLAAADELLDGPAAVALLRGRLAVVFGRGGLADYWCRAWRSTITALAEPLPVRTALVAAGGADLVAGDFLAALGDRHPVAELAGAFRPLLESPEVLAPVIASLEKSLEDPLVVADTHARVAAALQLFAGIADPKGLVAGLHDKLILTTPLKTLASKEFSAETGIGISAPASLRLGAAGFLRSLGQEAARPGWSLADLPVQESFWQNDLQLLAPATRLEFLNLVRELSTGSSIETREQLLGLFHLLRETGEHHSNQAAEILAAAADRQKPQGMQRMVGLLLDEVLMDPSPEPPWLPVAEILIGRLDFTGLQALQLELSPLPVEPLSTSPPQNEQISTSVISVGEANDPLRREKRQRLLDVVCAGLAEKEQSSLHRMLGFLGGKGEKCSTTPESQSGEKNTGEQDDGSLKKMFLGFKKLWKGR